MRSPFVKVYVKETNRDITDKIESFSFENSIEKDNLMQFKVKANYAFDLADDDDLVAGKTLSCQFGFLGELVSPVHVCKITDVEVNYGDRVSMTIKALDRGQDMKKNTSSKIWKGKTSSEIASEIAKVYGLTPVITVTTAKHTNLPQGQKTDFEFLHELTTKENGFAFYVADTELHFEKVDYDKKAVRQFTYGENIVSFSPKYKESQQKGAGRKTKVKSFDPDNKKPLNTEASPANGETKLADWDINGGSKFDIADLKARKGKDTVNHDGTEPASSNSGFDVSSLAQKGLSSSSLPAGSFDFKGLVTATNGQEKTGFAAVASQKEIVVPFLPPFPNEEQENTAKKIQNTGGHLGKKSHGAKILTASLSIEGDPTIKAGDIITISAVALRHQGNWFVEKINHAIGSSAYMSSLELRKNGTSKPATSGASKADGKVNKTVGAKVGDPKTTGLNTNIVHWQNDGSGKRVIGTGGKY